MKTAFNQDQEDQKKEIITEGEVKPDSESYWTCFCKENPRDPCCKIYEI